MVMLIKNLFASVDVSELAGSVREIFEEHNLEEVRLDFKFPRPVLNLPVPCVPISRLSWIGMNILRYVVLPEDIFVL